MPCADEVWRLQRGDDAECLAFQAIADQGHYKRKGGTRQGIYVIAPAGSLLASVNTLSAEKVLATMQAGLAAWEALPEGERSRAAGMALEPAHRWEMSYPEGGLVLSTAVRDLPESLDPSDPPGAKWNRDHAWFAADELRGWLPAQPVVGARQPLPRTLVRRLARYHLVDNVVGQTLPFADEELRVAELDAEVLSVEGGRVRLALEGRTDAEADGTWRMGQNDWTPRKPWPRGIRFELRGTATWDLRTQTFEAFELVGHGQWWGRGPFNGRRGEDPRGDLGIVLQRAPDGPADRVAPAFVDVYDADWIRQPEGS